MFAVGPDSAGADPGPICYGRGGQEPTITDANVVSLPNESGGGESSCASFMLVAILPMPSSRSDGIHDTVLMLEFDSHGAPS